MSQSGGTTFAVHMNPPMMKTDTHVRISDWFLSGNVSLSKNTVLI